MGLDDEQANIIEELKLENNDLGHQQITLISNFHNLRKLWIIKKAGYAATKDLSQFQKLEELHYSYTEGFISKDSAPFNFKTNE